MDKVLKTPLLHWLDAHNFTHIHDNHTQIGMMGVPEEAFKVPTLYLLCAHVCLLQQFDGLFFGLVSMVQGNGDGRIGLGDDESKQLALQVVRMFAEERKHPKAMWMLAYYFSSGLFGFQKNEEEAMKWHRKAADLGEPGSQVAVGTSLINGNEAEKQQAAELFRKAAEQGDEQGQMHFGRCLQKGWGVTKDEKAAFKMFYNAREFPPALMHLADCYADGVGVAKDAVAAFEYCRQAAEQGQCRSASQTWSFVFSRRRRG